jgi:hypothetical protein
LTVDDLVEARNGLSRSAVLERLRAHAKESRSFRLDPKAVFLLAEELADDAIDLRAWADAHRREHRSLGIRLDPNAEEALTWMMCRWSDAHAFDDQLFIDGAPLGPLETVQMFSTGFDAFDIPDTSTGVFYTGGTKSHAPLFCTHARDLQGEAALWNPDEMLLYRDFLPRLAAWRRFTREYYTSAGPCSKCGGVSMRLLTDEQLAYLRDVRALPPSGDGTVVSLGTWHRRT